MMDFSGPGMWSGFLFSFLMSCLAIGLPVAIAILIGAVIVRGGKK
jgi:hypothetical protein